jgi:hypothetical protein
MSVKTTVISSPLHRLYLIVAVKEKGTGYARGYQWVLTHPRERSVYDARIEPLRGFLIISHEEL